MENPDGFANITSELSDRGYAESDIEKVIGGNWMRLFREVWGE
jgi:membrane dipeptidase